MLEILYNEYKENFSNQKKKIEPFQSNEYINQSQPTKQVETESTEKRMIPLEIEIVIYVGCIMASIICFMVYQKSLDKSYFRKTYKLFFFVFIANLINLTWFSIYYNSKINNLVGITGPQGSPGQKGVRGDFVTCSFCDYNLYIQKTKNYNKIVTLSTKLEIDYNNNTTKTNKMIENVKNYGIDGYGIDMADFNLSSLRDPNKISDSFIDEISTIFDPITRMTFLSYYLNLAILKSNYSEKISFFRPIGGNGYYPVGYSVFKSANAGKSYAFLINGDIRLPVGYQPKFTFRNQEEMLENLNSNGNVIDPEPFKYTFLKPIPPKEYQIIEGTNIETLRVGNPKMGQINDLKEKAEVTEIKYGSMGEVIIRTQDIDKLKTEGVANDRNLCACIKLSCARKVTYDELSLVAIKISYKTEDPSSKVNQILMYMNNKSNLNSNDNKYKETYQDVLNYLDIYSIWKTPMNTFVTNCQVGTSNIMNGTLAFNLVNGNLEMLKSSREDLNKIGRKIIRKKLNDIKLPRIIRIVMIFTHLYNQYFDKLFKQTSENILLLRREVRNLKSDISTKTGSKRNLTTTKQKKERNNNIVDINRKIETLESIVNELGDTTTKEGQITRENLFSNFETIQIIMNNDNQTLLENNLPNYNIIKSELDRIPEFIDIYTSLYDLVMLMFDNNLKFNIAVDNKHFVNGGSLITNVQKEILKICMVCMPPNLNKEPIYMPKDSCLSFETISVERRKLSNKLEETLNEFNNILMYIKENPSKCNDFEVIQQNIRIMDNKFYNTLSQISNFMEKIEKNDIENFSDSRLKFIINEYQNIIRLMKNTCELDEMN